MIGLDFICKLYDKQFKDVAEELGVSKQVINGWIKGKYNISKKHLPRLSEIFQIPEEYFQKELNDVDQIEIQQKKIRNELVEYQYENTFIDEDGEKITITETQPNQEQVYESNFLEFKKNIIKLHNTIDGTIGSKFSNGVIDNDISLNADLFDAERLLELYEMFVRVINNGGIKESTIKEILKGIMHYQNKPCSLIVNENVLRISNFIKEEDKKHEF